MDGYQQVPRRVATGYFGLIFFIVLSVALVAGYVPIVLLLQQKSQDLELLNQKIETHIEDELRRAGNPLPVQQPVDGQTLRYGDDFFSELKDLALFGVNYNALVEKTGWPRPTTILEDIEAKLDGIARVVEDSDLEIQRHYNLRELIDYLENELIQTSARLKQRNEAFQRADADRKQRLEELEEARRDFERTLTALRTELNETKENTQKQISEFYDRWQASNDERSRLWEEYQKAEAEHKEVIERKEEAIDDLNSEIAMLREELRREVVEIPSEVVGSIMHSDLMRKFTIINRGQADQMEIGTELFVYRHAHGDRKNRIGKVVVVRLHERTSRADIIEMDDANPIMPGDHLYLEPPTS